MSLNEFFHFLKSILSKIQDRKLWGSIVIEFQDGSIKRVRENIDTKIDMKD